MTISELGDFFNWLEIRIIEWKAKHGLDILRVALGVIFFWFGVLKFFHGVSSAEVIAGKTILKLTFGYVKPAFSLPFLAVWECTIGLGLVFKSWLNLTLGLLYFQMLGTFLPLVFFPAETFNHSILIPTLLGQYIIKNIVLVSGGIVIGATIKGGVLTAKPVVKVPFLKRIYGGNTINKSTVVLDQTSES